MTRLRVERHAAAGRDVFSRRTSLHGQSIRSGLLALAVLAGCLLPIPLRAQAQNSDPALEAPAALNAPDDLLARGRKLEGERRWGEALTLYEDAFRANPGESQLTERIDLARIHYDLGRRYADSSFRNSLLALGENQALDLYTEVLNKVYAHYVQDPDWRHLVNHGTLDLEVALADPEFCRQNRLDAFPQRIDDFRRELHRTMDNRAIRDRDEARDAVDAAARLANSQLGLSVSAAILEFTSGASSGLDEYSTFLTPDQLNDLYSQIEGNFVGLGVELKANDNALLIVNVIHGSPADRASIRPGDRFVGVAGKSTHDLTTDQAAELLQGSEGTSVELDVVTGKEVPRRLVLRREHVEVPSVDNIRMADPDAGIGYLKLACFQKTTSRDLDTALWKLHRQGMKSLIMDLRGNPGGLLTAAVEVSEKFIDDGNIVSTKGRSPQEDYNYVAHRVGAWQMPLVVLIDGDSASASEIFAGAIRDHHRGLIVGTRSYGKGSVQGIFPLNITGTGIRLTTAKFYSPDGHPFVHVGVAPDIQVRQTAKPIDGQIAPQTSDADDATLSAGLQAARRQLAQR